jgi:hypothetical protein
MPRLTLGAVLANAALAGIFQAMYVEYNRILAGLLGLALPQGPPLLPPEVVMGAVALACVLYAAAVDDTPYRALKGLAMAAVALSMGYAIDAAGYGRAVRVLLEALGAGSAAVSSSVLAMVAGAAAGVAAVKSAVTILLAGLVVSLSPTVIAYVWSIYASLVWNPLKYALLKVLAVFARRVTLGFLMPVGIYAVSVVGIALAMPVVLIAVMWLAGVVLGLLVAAFSLGPYGIAVNALLMLAGAAIGAAISAWAARFAREVPPEFLLLGAPVLAVFLAVAMGPVVIALAYSLQLLPAATLAVSVALVASPTLRVHLDRFIAPFMALFLLQAVAAVMSALAASGMAGLSALVFAMGAVDPAAALTSPVKFFLAVAETVITAAQHYNATTGCFDYGAGIAPYGPVFHQTPPWWWLPADAWYNPAVWYEPELWAATGGNPHPYDAACNPRLKPFAR